MFQVAHIIRPLLMVSTVLAFLPSLASERSYTFNFQEEDISFYGTGRKEICDIAVCLDNPALAGFTVMGISVKLPGNPDDYESLSAFLTKELKVELVDGLRVNVPDVCIVDAVIENGMLTASFLEPYKITSDPIYVGYSFSIKELNDDTMNPLAVVSGKNPDGLWFHSNRTSLKWTNYVDKTASGLQSAINILIEGDFRDTSATLDLPSRLVYKTGEQVLLSFPVQNFGYDVISSIECDWSIGEKSGTSFYEFPVPVRNVLGASADAKITLPLINDQGTYPLNLTLSRVNGLTNFNSISHKESNITYADVVPVHLPFVEEYTGLWCGNCPRGYAALEWMKEEYGWQFVAASWHNNDEMAVTNDYPSNVRGFPTSWIDRKDNIDPSAIPAQWTTLRDKESDLAISCKLYSVSDSRLYVIAKTTVFPITDCEGPLKLGYILVADGLSNPTWLQSNYYSGEISSDLPGIWAEFFANASKKVLGLTYNDVVVEAGFALGVPNSLPSMMNAFTPYEHEVTFKIDDIRNNSGNKIDIDSDKIRVLAFIIDEDGSVLNSCSSEYPKEGNPNMGTDVIEADIDDTIWYDLTGNRVSPASGGIFIRVDILSDGSRYVSKVVVP